MLDCMFIMESHDNYDCLFSGASIYNSIIVDDLTDWEESTPKYDYWNYSRRPRYKPFYLGRWNCPVEGSLLGFEIDIVPINHLSCGSELYYCIWKTDMPTRMWLFRTYLAEL